MPKTLLPTDDAAILTRLVGLDESRLPPAGARVILRLRFSPADKECMHRLAAKARAGSLTAAEQADIEAYSRVGSLVGILKSKARRALKRATSTNGKTRSTP